MHKLNMVNVRASAKEWPCESVGTLQVALYVMCGGGGLGESAAQHPAEFYIDDRCGRLPYSKRAIMQAVAVLIEFAQAHGMDPRRMPRMPEFHRCGVF